MKDVLTPTQLRLDLCLFCGEPLPDGNNNRRTHDRCRIKLFRWHRRNRAAYMRIINDLKTLSEYGQHPLGYDRFLVMIKEINAELSRTLTENRITRIR